MANLTIRSNTSLMTSDPKTIETVRSCLCEMKRVEEIKFAGIPGSILEEIFRDFPKSVPQLHTLCIQPFSGPAFSIDDDFFYDTENLQRVELINCKISWDSPLLAGLTRLNLQNSLKPNSSIIQVLQALQRMPALTNLDLNNSIPNDSAGLFSYPTVDLPLLRALNISSGADALTAILRHITFPHSALLKLTCKENQSIQIGLSSIFSVLATKFLSNLVFRSLSFRVSNDKQTHSHSLKFCLWTSAFIPFSQISQSQLQLLMRWLTSQPHSYLEALTCAFDVINLSFLTQVQISTPDHIDSQTLVKTFGKLPLLERVCVQRSALCPFLEALVYKTMAAEESEEAYHSVSFPKLRYIHLEGTDFFTRRAKVIDTLLDCLMERYERNAEVQVLRLDNCYDISSNEVERLKEIVVDVIWDGIEQENEYRSHSDE